MLVVELQKKLKGLDEKPRILWHFASYRETAHLDNLTLLRDHIGMDVGDEKRFGDRMYRLSEIKARDGSLGGYVMLIPSGTKPQRKSKEELVEEWCTGLEERGITLEKQTA